MLFPSLLITRGAPGRLMKLEDMQALLDDFCIPLQLATGHSQKHSMAKPPVRLVTHDIIAYCSNTPSMKSYVPQICGISAVLLSEVLYMHVYT